MLKEQNIGSEKARIIEEADSISRGYFDHLKKEYGVELPFGYVILKGNTVFLPGEKTLRYYTAPKATVDYFLNKVVVSDEIDGDELLAVLVHEAIHLNAVGFCFKCVGGFSGGFFDEGVTEFLTREALAYSGSDSRLIDIWQKSTAKWKLKEVRRIESIIDYMQSSGSLFNSYFNGKVEGLPVIPITLSKAALHGNCAVIYKGRRMPFATARKKILEAKGKTADPDSVYVLIERGKGIDPVVSRFVGARVQRPGPGKEKAGYSSFRYLRNLNDPNITCNDILRMLLSLSARNKKVVIGFDNGLPAAALDIFREIKSFKEGPSPLAGWLSNVEIIIESPASLVSDLGKACDEKYTEVFVFARYDERKAFKEIEPKLNAGYTDASKGFPIFASHPLPYEVAIVFAEADKKGRGITSRLNSNISLLHDLNLAKIAPPDDMAVAEDTSSAGDAASKKKICLVFEPDPEAKPFDTEGAFRKNVAMWKELMRNA